MLDAAQLIVETTDGTVAHIKHRIRVLLVATLVVLVVGQLVGMGGIVAFSWMQTGTAPAPGMWLPMAGFAAPVPVLAAVLWLSLGLVRMLTALPAQAVRTLVVTAEDRRQRQQKQRAAQLAQRERHLELVPQPELPRLPYPSQPYPAVPNLLPPEDEALPTFPTFPSHSLPYSQPNTLPTPDQYTPDLYGRTPPLGDQGYARPPFGAARLAPIPAPTTSRRATGQRPYAEISEQPTRRLNFL